MDSPNISQHELIQRAIKKKDEDFGDGSVCITYNEFMQKYYYYFS